MTLYLKYRPQTISELDSKQARTRLMDIINSGNLPHAFLFSGPRGVGKTSAARILAKAVNCEKNRNKLGEPCNKCEACLKITKGNHMDVVELDAASHRGIDDIRALRENIALSPSSAQKKVYILDEAHMLTLEAANAFLKTLEEPPQHVLFILATTDPQKLPTTIHSRLTTIPFNRASEDEIFRQLERITKGEKLKLDNAILKLVAQVSDGSFRDAAKNMEILVTSGIPKDLKEVKKILQGSSDTAVTLLNALCMGETPKALQITKDYCEANGSVKDLVDQLITNLRQHLISLQVEDKPLYKLDMDSSMRLINNLFEARNNLRVSPIASLPIEMAIIAFRKTPEKKVPDPAPDESGSKEKKVTPVEKNLEAEKKFSTNGHSQKVDKNIWLKILDEASGKNSTIEALLRSACPLEFDGSNLKVGVYYRFHKEQLEMQKNRLALEQICSGILGREVRVFYEVTKRREPLPPKKDPPLTETHDDDIIQAAKEIFGS